MRIVAVGRVLNEDDVIEAFVRHTLAFADHIILLDNGSSDRTLAILAALRAEGAPLTVMQARAAVFVEVHVNTLLYHTAREAFAPDWVFHLDCDEFLDLRAAELRPRLAAVPPTVQGLKLPLRNYYADGPAGEELLVPRRMVMRAAGVPGVWKCMLRGTLPPQLTVAGGNHDAAIGLDPVRTETLDELPLAHYPERNVLQTVTKAALGRFKVIAGGGGPEVVAAVSNHYTPVLEMLLRDPAGLLNGPHRMGESLPPIPLVEDPIRYEGGPLRYTLPGDPAIKALQAAAHAMNTLAASHGALLDADPAARARLATEGLRPDIVIR